MELQPKERRVGRALVQVRRESSTPPGMGVPDSYDLYSARIDEGEWRAVRSFLNSQAYHEGVKQAIVDLCQKFYEDFFR